MSSRGRSIRKRRSTGESASSIPEPDRTLSWSLWLEWIAANAVGWAIGGFLFAVLAPRGPEFEEYDLAFDRLVSELISGGGLGAEAGSRFNVRYRGGIPLDATVTNDLLVTIFRPGTPLHDGAVIIQGERIAAAACFLPLTVNPRLSKDLGTRHRAAIGLTEESDAVAVIVSEETGIISLALDGHIERGLDPERLRSRLRGLLATSRSRAARRRDREASAS